MKRLVAVTVSAAMLLVGLVFGAAPAAALDPGTFTVSGWTNGNLTIDNLTIARDTAGTYTVKALTFTVGGKQATVYGFGDSGCTPNGAECKVINSTHIEVRDNFVGYWFIADLSGMDGPAPTLTMYDAKYTPQYWDGFGSRPSTGIAPSLIPSTPTLTAITPSTSTEAGGGTAEISGANLTGATSVTIGGRAVSIVAATGDKVVVSIPSMPASATVGTPVDVVVTTPAGTATLPAAFTYTTNPPSISGVTPSCGVKPGASLTVSGYRFAGATTVTIGGQSLPFTVTDPNPGTSRITTTAPALSGSQPVIITTPAGSNSGVASVSYLPCAPLPTLTLKVTSTTSAGGFATIQWSFPPGDPDLGNVLGLQFAFAPAGLYTNVGGTQSGTSGSFTVAGLTKPQSLVWVKVVNSNPQGNPAYKAVGVAFTTAPTPLPPNTGNAGSVPPPAVSGGGSPAGGGTPSGGGASGGSTPVDAPCLAPKGSLYPNAYGTVGSQIVVVPGRPGDESPTDVSVTSGALPPGVGLDSFTGIAYGVPTAAGRYSAAVDGRYADGSKAVGTLDFVIDNDAQTLTYPVVVAGGVGQTMTAGPTTNAPVGSTYGIVCGKVPPGTTFDPRTGVISGTPTTEDLANPPLRIAERNSAGSAAASFIVVVGPTGAAQLSYPAHPHLRTHKVARIRPSVVAAGDLLYYKVLRGKLNRALRLNPKSGLVTGRPARITGHRMHTVTIAGVQADGTLVVANPMMITVRRGR